MMALKRPSLIRGIAARYRRDARGATAVEFGLVALPFIMLLVGIIELGLFFVVSVVLDNAVYSVSRQIRTGEMSSANGSLNGFKTAICSRMGFLQSNCLANLTVDVRTASQFSGISMASPITNNVFNPGTLTFNTGNAGDIVIARAYYRWRLFAPTINQALERLPGETLITSAITFRNEPFAS